MNQGGFLKMILTVTLNPSMDAIYFTDTFTLGQMNRCNPPIKTVGGKGINASRTAAILGSQVQAIVVLAGVNGALIRTHLETETFASIFLTIPGESRNAVTIMDQMKNQTEIVELGPEITSVYAQQILEKITQLSTSQKKITTIAICGSTNTKNEQLYKHYLEEIHSALGSSVNVLTDISGLQLKNVLKGTIKPYFIKPNMQEFSELIQQPLTHKKDVLRYLSHQLLDQVPFVLISCGSLGAIARVNGELFDLTIPKIEVVNPTGSGDATVGGIAYSLDHRFSTEETLQYAMACGISNALEPKVGVVKMAAVLELKKNIKITRL